MFPCPPAFMVTLWYTRQPSAPGHCLCPEFLPRVDVTDHRHLELRITEDLMPKWLDTPWCLHELSWIKWDFLMPQGWMEFHFKLKFEHKHICIETIALNLELSTWMDRGNLYQIMLPLQFHWRHQEFQWTLSTWHQLDPLGQAWRIPILLQITNLRTFPSYPIILILLQVKLRGCSMNSSSHLTRSTSTLIRGRSQTPSWSQRRIGFTESAGKTHLLNKNSRGANLYFHPHFRHVFFRRGGERLRYITYIYIYIYIYLYNIHISERRLTRFLVGRKKSAEAYNKSNRFSSLPNFMEWRVEAGNGSSTDRICTGMNPESSGVYMQNLSQSPPNETRGGIGCSANKILWLFIFINSLYCNEFPPMIESPMIEKVKAGLHLISLQLWTWSMAVWLTFNICNFDATYRAPYNIQMTSVDQLRLKTLDQASWFCQIHRPVRWNGENYSYHWLRLKQGAQEPTENQISNKWMLRFGENDLSAKLRVLHQVLLPTPGCCYGYREIEISFANFIFNRSQLWRNVYCLYWNWMKLLVSVSHKKIFIVGLLPNICQFNSLGAWWIVNPGWNMEFQRFQPLENFKEKKVP